MLLFVDTETTGLTSDAYLVQLAAMLTENDGTLRGSCNLIVKPDGYDIPKESYDIHGITTEIALRSGVPIAIAIAVFNNFALQCDGGMLVGHNLQFDVKKIEAAYRRGNWPSRISSLQQFCTMEHTVNRVRIPPTPKMVARGMRNFKSPKLSEAYEFAFKKPLLNAHDALYDVMACKDLYFWIHGSTANEPILNNITGALKCEQSSSTSTEPSPTLVTDVTT